MKRIPQLDGVRGVAILLILVWHYFVCVIPAEPKTLIHYCSRAVSLSWSGVDLFFVLSGFLIAGILLDHRNTTNFFRVFFLRRACRILPLYFLLLGLFICLSAAPFFSTASFQWLFQNPLPLWSYATFTQNIFMGMRGDFGPSWLAVTWSLAVEEQFYLFVPFLIYVLPRRALVCVLVAAIVAAPVLRHLYPGFHAYVGTPWRADSLLSGALLAVLVRWKPFVAAVRQHPRIVLAIFFTLLVGAGVMQLPWIPFGTFHYLLLAFLYSSFVLIAFMGSSPLLRRILGSPVLVWFGQLSYGIYMFHQVVHGLLYGFLRQGPPQIHSLADAGITLLSLCITLVLATLSYRFFESPLIRLAHRVRYSGKPQQISTQEAASNAA